jgi:PAS domain S-box-containing protein
MLNKDILLIQNGKKEQVTVYGTDELSVLANSVNSLLESTNRVQQEKLDKEREYHNVVNNVQDIIFKINAHGCIIFLNPVWEKISGYPMDETIGNHFLNYFYNSKNQSIENYFEVAKHTTKDIFFTEKKLVKKDGSFCWMSISILQENNAVGYFGIMRDITFRKEYEKELEYKDQLLQTALESIQNLFLDDQLQEAIMSSLYDIGKTINADRIRIYEYNFQELSGLFVAKNIFDWSKDCDVIIDNSEDE